MMENNTILAGMCKDLSQLGNLLNEKFHRCNIPMWPQMAALLCHQFSKVQLCTSCISMLELVKVLILYNIYNISSLLGIPEVNLVLFFSF